MLTSAQLQYLRSQGIPVTTRATSSGKVVVGGDAQYSAALTAPDAIDNFRSFVKATVGDKVDSHLASKYPRATNQRYRAKHMEALAYKNAVSPVDDDYQYLKQEAETRGVTVAQMANLIINASNVYNEKVAAVEKRRIQFNTQVDAAATLDQVHTLWLQAEQAIEGL